MKLHDSSSKFEVKYVSNPLMMKKVKRWVGKNGFIEKDRSPGELQIPEVGIFCRYLVDRCGPLLIKVYHGKLFEQKSFFEITTVLQILTQPFQVKNNRCSLPQKFPCDLPVWNADCRILLLLLWQCDWFNINALIKIPNSFYFAENLNKTS